MPLPQTTHCSVTRWPGCLGQKRKSFTSGMASGLGSLRWMRTTAGAEDAADAAAADDTALGAETDPAGAACAGLGTIGGGAGGVVAGGTAGSEARTEAGGSATWMAGADVAGAGAGGAEGWGTISATGLGAPPNSWRICALMVSERFAPQPGHENCTGLAAMSGVTSKAYFAPHAHWIFMGQGFGFSNTTPAGNGSGNVANEETLSTWPSVKRKLPPRAR